MAIFQTDYIILEENRRIILGKTYMKAIKKLFGGIDFTWKKLIVFAIIVAIYTAAMAIIPITKDTSFRDIAATLEWWILFGVIIISNSKSPKDSAIKCFTFFLIKTGI